MADLSISVGDVASLLVILGSLLGFWVWLERRMERHSREHVATNALLSLLVKDAAARSPAMKAQLAGFNALLSAWEKRHAEVGNPITAEEARHRQELTSRLEAGEDLTKDELLGLQEILQEELKDAEKTNAELTVVIAIVVILGLVVVALALAARS